MDIFELSVHCQNKANLVMMEIFFDICLYLVWKYLTEDFFVSVFIRILSNSFLLFIVPLQVFGIRVIQAS